MATHSRILAWRIPWKESLAGYSPWVANSWTQLSGLLEIQRQIPYDITYMWNLKSYTNESVYRAEMYRTGNSTQYPIMTYMEKNLPKSGDVCIWLLERPHCPSGFSLFLQNAVSKYGAQFQGNAQHDALEFLLWLLDRVHEDLEGSSRGPSSDKVSHPQKTHCVQF